MNALADVKADRLAGRQEGARTTVFPLAGLTRPAVVMPTM